jgi:ornithine carbamoyltransferase
MTLIDHPTASAPSAHLKDLVRAADLTPANLTRLLTLASDAKRQPYRFASELAGQMVVLYFTKPSTRTRLSFSAAAARLGASPVVVGPTELQIGRGETIEDTARVISGYAAALVVRTYADDDVRRLADAATIPVINGLTDGHHPCQSLADLLTLREHFGRLAGLRIAYVGDGNNVVHSLMEACALAGVDITVATPEGYDPDPGVVAGAHALAAGTPATVRVVRDPEEAVRGVDAVYTDVWVSMGDPEDQRVARAAALEPYRVDTQLMRLAAPHAVFLHCLPAHRGDEVTAEVMRSDQSLVFHQAENRLHTATAVLLALTKGRLDGATR